MGLSLISACNQSITTTKTLEAKEPHRQATAAVAQRFDGTTVTFVALKYPIGNAFAARAKEFEAMTGAKIVFKPAAFGELYDFIAKDYKNKANQYDVIVYTPLWLPDLVNANYLADISDRVKTDPVLQWNDITPFYQKYSASYHNKIYGLPVDGDYYMLYYRSDLLEKAGFKPPSTWDEYLAIAKHFHGKDLNGDGTPDYGSCLPKLRNHVISWAFWSIASSFLQTQGTNQGGFFDPETMKPLINNQAFAKALAIYKKTGEYGPPDELKHSMDDTRERFIGGRCALTMDHGNTGTLTIAPGSKVVDKVGTSILPGTKEVLDRKTGKLVTCDKFNCPYAVNGVNHAPYAALIGWTAGVNASSPPQVQAAAYAFISYVSQPAQSNVDVTVGETGFNPYRVSQFSSNQIWVKAGMSPSAANKYLGGIGASLNNPNMMMDLTIPNNNGYQQKILDSAVADFLAGDINLNQAVTTIDTEWEKLTEKMGRSQQKTVYRIGLGLNP
ncbi:extracellular solute-binding protein [Calothrix sp. FACHB-1219]|uniref:ABC transporter substrate-binding protein n=1 Tax=unclassified Calothrix TaxID=2619626 RepID=UPI00168A31A3|nr:MULTISPECIES: extracellular solute-binding protein [unclassified Calothrix]MBD2204120.1 extracellular solute-binding protein [Calothrix sp. FACHB-168]MBD2220934.1 extracellular solute-binding protein [Calothrix sp. FACHB-1219]